MSAEGDEALIGEAFAYLQRVKWEIQVDGIARVLLDEGRGISVPGSITVEMAEALGMALVSCAQRGRSMSAVYRWLNENSELDDSAIGDLISKLHEYGDESELGVALRSLMSDSH